MHVKALRHLRIGDKEPKPFWSDYKPGKYCKYLQDEVGQVDCNMHKYRNWSKFKHRMAPLAGVDASVETDRLHERLAKLRMEGYNLRLQDATKDNCSRRHIPIRLTSSFLRRQEKFSQTKEHHSAAMQSKATSTEGKSLFSSFF
jgi:hypothetical protein